MNVSNGITDYCQSGLPKLYTHPYIVRCMTALVGPNHAVFWKRRLSITVFKGQAERYVLFSYYIFWTSTVACVVQSFIDADEDYWYSWHYQSLLALTTYENCYSFCFFDHRRGRLYKEEQLLVGFIFCAVSREHSALFHLSYFQFYRFLSVLFFSLLSFSGSKCGTFRRCTTPVAVKFIGRLLDWTSHCKATQFKSYVLIYASLWDEKKGIMPVFMGRVLARVSHNYR